MIYEHDPESPFRKILVKNDGTVVGIIRRSLVTGKYQFYDGFNSLSSLFEEPRIDSMKVKIERMTRERFVQ